MSRGENRHRRRRAQEYAIRRRDLAEKERKGQRLRHGLPVAELEPVEAHDPAHVTGCLRCFVARNQEASS